MKSFTDYYFNYGFNSTVEKTAAQKKEDEGMGLGAKLGLGAAGVGAAGLGAYYGGDALKALGEYASSMQAPMSLEGLAGTANEAAGGVGEALSSAGQFANENLRDPMQAAAGHISQLAHNAPAMASQAKEAVGEAAGKAGDYMSNKGQDVSDYIKGLMGNPTPGSKQFFELDHLLQAPEAAKNIPYR